jgi:hypothetical protein
MRAIQVNMIKLMFCLVLSSYVGAIECSVALARSGEVAAARAQFEQGDIMIARDRLKKSAPRLKGEERVEAFKLLGICNFLTGDRDGAKAAFKEVLNRDPGASLAKRDVLDPSLTDFFEEIKRGYAGKVGVQRRTSSRPNRSNKALAAKSLGGAADSRVAAITVTTNAPGATVFANGLFVGTANQQIELPPGSYKISVSAAGFNPAAESITVNRGDRLQLRFNLDDPETIERRKRLAQLERRRKASEAAAAAKAEEKARMQQLAAQMAARKKAEAELMDLERREAAQKERERQKETERRAQQLAIEQAVQAKMAEEAAAKDAARRGDAYLKRLGARKLQQKPEKRGGKIDYSADLPRGKQSLADEFRQDQVERPPPDAEPRNAPPLRKNAQSQQQYAQPQQLYAQPQQQYGQPPQQQYAQPQQQYAQPQQQYAQPPQPPQQAYAPPPQQYPQPVAPRVRKSGKSAFVAVMPFGVGQFQNDSYTLGTASALLQAGALGWGIYSYTLYSSAEASFQEESNRNSDKLEQSYVDATQTYLARWKLNAAFGFIGFGVIWIASGIEALASLNDDVSAGYLRTSHSSDSPGQNVGNAIAAEPAASMSLLPVAKMDGTGFGLEIKIKF